MTNMFEWVKLGVQVAMFAVALWFGSMIKDVRDTAVATNEAIGKILILVETGPEGINAVGDALRGQAEGAGRAGAGALETIGDAVRDWRKPKEGPEG